MEKLVMLSIVAALFAVTFANAVTASPLSVSVTPANSTVISGSYLNLTATATGGDGNYQYQWFNAQTNNPMGGNSNRFGIKLTNLNSNPLWI